MRAFKVTQAWICSMENFTCVQKNFCFPGCCKMGACEACSGWKPVSDLRDKSVASDFNRIASDSGCQEQMEQLAPDIFTTSSHTVPDLTDSCDITHLKLSPPQKLFSQLEFCFELTSVIRSCFINSVRQATAKVKKFQHHL